MNHCLNTASWEPQLKSLTDNAYSQISNFTVSFKEVNREIVYAVMKYLDLSMVDLYRHYKTHTVVHASWGLFGRYVRTEKLLRMIKDRKDAPQLLAVDGLGGNLNSGPHFEYKAYMPNLTIGPEGAAVDYMDTFPEYKRKHVQTVRKMYEVLKDVEEPQKYVYSVMQTMCKEVSNKELPSLKEEVLDPTLLEKALDMYVTNMEKKEMEELFNHLKCKGEKRSSEDEHSE